MSSQERFVGNGKEVSSLLSTRDELYRNTLQIIELVRERIRLAEEIGREKDTLGLPLRNRQRELEVLDSIPSLGEIEKSILNMIFEITILNESNERPMISLPESDGEGRDEVVLTGPENLLQYSLGLIASHPGLELRDNAGIPENLALGVIQGGGHITSLGNSNSSGSVTLVSQDGEELASIRDGKLAVSHNLLTGKSEIKIMEAI